MKWDTGEIILFKNIGKGPVTVSIYHVINAHCNPYSQGCSERLIMQGIARIRGNIPFGVVKRSCARLFFCLKRARAHNIFWRMFELSDSFGANFTKCICWKNMSGDKVGRQLIDVAIM